MPNGGVALELLNVQGVRLEVKHLAGRVAGAPTLVFLHEGLGCVQMWRDFPDKLVAATGCSGFVFSRRGYGRSEACPLPRSMRYLHDEALQVLPQVVHAADLGKHLLIGHSDGASIALIYAGAGVRDGLAGIVSMAPHVFCEALSVRSIRQARAAFEHGDLRDRLASYHRDNVECAFRGWSDAWLDSRFQDWNIEQYLPGITVPQLVLQGDRDHYGTLDQVRAIEDKSGGEVVVRVLADCGHSPYRERPQECLEAIRSFVAGLEEGTSDD